MKRICVFTCALVLLMLTSAGAKSGDMFNMATDIHWSEIELEFRGICICPRPPPIFFEEGEIWAYWEPYMVLSTVSQPFYFPYWGQSFGGSAAIDKLGGKNSSSDSANPASDSTFSQAHAWFNYAYFNYFCERNDYGMWFTEHDVLWQSDELSAIIHPEAALFANKAMQMACEADALATMVDQPLDFMHWCMGCGGSSYPMTGHVDNDDIIQANNTAAGRLVFKLTRQMMICDATPLCGCDNEFNWTKSHYKTHVIRPGDRSPAWSFGAPVGNYQWFLNPTFPPFMGEKGSTDEFMWMVYRRQMCCSCCET